MPLQAVVTGPGSRLRTSAYLLCLVASTAVLCPAPARGAASPGGAYASPAPVVKAVRCRTHCAGSTYARTGSLLALRGRNFDGAEAVVFLGTAAAGDEVAVDPERVSATRLTVRIPRGTRSGAVSVINGDGAASPPARRSRIRVEDVATRRATTGPGPQIEIAVPARKVFFDADRLPTLTYVVRDPQPVHVIVELVRSGDGVAIVRWDQGTVAPGVPGTVTWDGLAGGAVQKEGRYEFRVYAENAQGVRASTAQVGQPAAPAQTASPDSFVFLRHRFPIRGPHTFGAGEAAFGGGRNHQGHDVFAECGTPLVAARGGVVKLNAHHARAGHYIVIDGEQTDVDYVYMHLRDPSPFAKGTRVRTGQIVGHVGDTGRASGCHLHFELWSGPGWYTGGVPFDPLPQLRAWDRFS